MKITGKILFIISGILMVLPAALSAAPGYCAWANVPGWHHPMMYGGGLFMWIFNIVLFGLVVYFIVKFLRNTAGSSVNRDNPLDILKGRLAKGEITKEEFESLKRTIHEA